MGVLSSWLTTDMHWELDISPASTASLESRSLVASSTRNHTRPCAATLLVTGYERPGSTDRGSYSSQVHSCAFRGMPPRAINHPGSQRTETRSRSAISRETPSPTDYKVWCFGFSLLLWSILHRFLLNDGQSSWSLTRQMANKNRKLRKCSHTRVSLLRECHHNNMCTL